MCVHAVHSVKFFMVSKKYKALNYNVYIFDIGKYRNIILNKQEKMIFYVS